MQMAEFTIDLRTGRVAIVVLPVGISAVEMLTLISALPAVGSQASAAGKQLRSRLLVPAR